MTALEALQAVRYINVNDKQYAVIDAEEWEAVIEWLETLEDLQIFQQAQTELQAAGGDPVKAGWLRWDDIRDELE
ncbi:MAG: hypothetical protein R2911_25885 [Caldilineaceae bacterium]